MTGGGLFVLVAYGSQNVVLSGNPDYTYFYLVVRKHSHFSFESATIPLEGPQELFFDEPIQLRAKIQRIGDLLSDLYFSFTLPDIYSKYVAPASRGSQYEFQWVRNIGAQIIQKASFLVGGYAVQEFDSDYLITEAQIDQDETQYNKWQELVGDVPELYDPANGQYSGGNGANVRTTLYPTVTPDPTLNVQNNAPSIPGREVTLPLGFWFSKQPNLALPLVALQYHECEVQLTLRPIRELYTVLDASGSRVRPLNQIVSSVYNQRTGNVQYNTSQDQGMYIRNYLTDIGFAVPDLNTWPLNARLQGTYIYLTDEERNTFVTKPLNYMVRQITRFPFFSVTSRQLFDLYTQNPVPRIIVLPRRSDAVQFRNSWTNYTNWWRYPTAPFIPNNSGIQGQSGLLVAGTQQDIIRNIRVVCDGNEIQEPKPLQYLREVSSWKYTTGVFPEGLAIYSFALDSSSYIKPSGSLNSSRVRKFQLDVEPWPLITNTNYTFDFVVYVETLNFFRVEGGMGGVVFSA